MKFRFVALACLSLLAACSDAGTLKARGAGQTASAKVAPDATAVATTANAPAGLPDDVSRFIARRKECDHFRGEEAYDEERGKFLAEKMDGACKGTDGELAQLKAKYVGRGDLTKRLSEFESMIE